MEHGSQQLVWHKNVSGVGTPVAATVDIAGCQASPWPVWLLTHSSTTAPCAVCAASTPQDFPYHFDQDITHWLLWSASKPLDRNEIDVQVAARFPGEEALVFVNPAPLQSVLAVRRRSALRSALKCAFPICIAKKTLPM